jgi:hypothetical protein
MDCRAIGEQGRRVVFGFPLRGCMGIGPRGLVAARVATARKTLQLAATHIEVAADLGAAEAKLPEARSLD